MTERQRTVDAEALRKMGFAEDMIEEALLRQRRGVMDIQPPADLVKRVIAHCARLFEAKEDAEQEPDEFDSEWTSLVHAIGLGRTAATSLPGSTSVDMATQLYGRYTRSLAYAFVHHDRPMVICENHNVVDLSWWHTDPIFRSMRAACGSVNLTARDGGLDPTALVVILRPNVQDYDHTDLQTIGKLIEEATSDVWWLPYHAAQHFANQDVVAVGDDSVLRMENKADSPLKAIAAMKSSDDPAIVKRFRTEILACTHRAAAIKVNGRLWSGLRGAASEPDKVRLALGRVIAGKLDAFAP
jgi:hypothetical protein